MASVIADCIAKELGKGRMIDPLPTLWRPLLHVNRFGLIPKGHNNGKFRLITDLSFPHGASVNDGISSDLVSLSYISVDDVAEIVQELGRGALLAKMDIEAAYWLIPVHPQDRILQGMVWSMSTPAFCLVYSQHQNYSTRWRMHCAGAFSRLVSSGLCTT